MAVTVIFCSAVFILVCKLVTFPFIVAVVFSTLDTLLVILDKLVSIDETLLFVVVIWVVWVSIWFCKSSDDIDQSLTLLPLSIWAFLKDIFPFLNKLNLIPNEVVFTFVIV